MGCGVDCLVGSALQLLLALHRLHLVFGVSVLELCVGDLEFSVAGPQFRWRC